MALWLSLTRQMRNVNQWLTALQSIAIIVGVIVAIWQLSAISEQNKIQGQTLKQSQLAASATLVLQFRDKLDGDKYSKISSAIQNHKTNYPLLSRYLVVTVVAAANFVRE